MSDGISYSAEWLQRDRPQPMYDRSINRLYKTIFYDSPVDNKELVTEFKTKFLDFLRSDKLNRVRGYDEGFYMDPCIGCTHYIDDLYQSIGKEKLMTLEHDYKYHLRLNPNIRYYTVDTLEKGKHLLIAMPFPSMGDIHPDMNRLLERCFELEIPVHIDAAWLTCSKEIDFDFSHPAISSFAISLSKGLGTGGNRIAMRFTRIRPGGPITIMNDFNMNCQSLLHIGCVFMEKLGANYFWHKYGESYQKVCEDFDLKPTKAIHLAISKQGPVGVRHLLRLLKDS
jgi:hypothetical protein